jgi:uncharacterized protein
VRDSDVVEALKDVAAAFNAVPIDDMQNALRGALRDRSLVQSRFVEMHSAWLSHDFSRLLTAAESTPLLALPTLRSALIENRNRNWLSQIEAMLNTGHRILVVVGALHLVGTNGLLQLLDTSSRHAISIG